MQGHARVVLVCRVRFRCAYLGVSRIFSVRKAILQDRSVVGEEKDAIPLSVGFKRTHPTHGSCVSAYL